MGRCHAGPEADTCKRHKRIAKTKGHSHGRRYRPPGGGLQDVGPQAIGALLPDRNSIVRADGPIRHIIAGFLAQNSPCTTKRHFTVTRISSVTHFMIDDGGAITVDWTVLSAAAVSMAIATTAVLTDTIDILAGRMDDELRSRQLSDDWIQFYASHFGPILESGYMSEAEAEVVYNTANDMMNYEVLSQLEAGIAALEGGTITAEGLVELVAIASVAYQRNISDDGMLDYYFGFGGSDPYYMTVALAETGT
jgi:hypothetical protein